MTAESQRQEGYIDGGRAVCQHCSHTHTAECVQLERQTPDAGETVVDEQVEQGGLCASGKKTLPFTRQHNYLEERAIHHKLFSQTNNTHLLQSTLKLGFLRNVKWFIEEKKQDWVNWELTGLRDEGRGLKNNGLVTG